MRRSVDISSPSSTPTTPSEPDVQPAEDSADESSWFFFYDELMDPSRLMSSSPTTQTSASAKPLSSATPSPDGACRALVRGTLEDVVPGYACVIDRVPHEARLARCYLGAFKEEKCRILLADLSGTVGEVARKVLVYAGDPGPVRISFNS